MPSNDLSVYRTLRACQNPCCNLTLHEQTGEYFPNNPRTYEPVLRFRIDEDAAGQRTLHRKQMQICAKKIYTKGSKKAGVFCRVTLYVLLCTFRPSLALPLSLSFSLPLSLFLSLSLSFSLSLSLSFSLSSLFLSLSVGCAKSGNSLKNINAKPSQRSSHAATKWVVCLHNCCTGNLRERAGHPAHGQAEGEAAAAVYNRTPRALAGGGHRSVWRGWRYVSARHAAAAGDRQAVRVNRPGSPEQQSGGKVRRNAHSVRLRGTISSKKKTKKNAGDSVNAGECC